MNFMGVAVARANRANSRTMVSFCILILQHGHSYIEDLEGSIKPVLTNIKETVERDVR